MAGHVDQGQQPSGERREMNRLFKLFPKKDSTATTAAIEFEAQMALSAQSSKRIAWLVATACLLIAGLAILAVIAMLPLKQTVPYLIYVDKSTGITQVVDVATPSKITQDEVNAKHWVTRYIQARERYIYQLLQEDYDFVMATSDAAQQKIFAKIFEPGPNKKDAVLRDQVEERIRIASVQLAPGQAGRATVRFIKETYRAGAREPEKVETMIVDLAFGWAPVGAWTEKNRLINPLGFRVLAYRVTPELTQQPQ